MDVSTEFMKLIDQVAEDGELTFNEIGQLAKWLNANKEGRKLWPASVFIKLLQNVFADGKIDRSEAAEVGKLIQTVRREWSRNWEMQCFSKAFSVVVAVVHY